MGASLLITLREGLEAALIISIILAFLSRMDQPKQIRSVWLGAGAAVAASLAAGAVVFWTAGELSGRAEELYEGTAMLVAVAVLSYMVMWMRKQARFLKGHLEAQVESALKTGSTFAMGFLAFVVVIREGIETVLFLFSAWRVDSDTSALFLGGLIGLAVAITIGYLGYKGSRFINLRTFFNVTGVLLIIFAAGLLAHGIHEFQEAGVFPVIQEEVWNTNGVLNEKAGIGSFVKALFGYNGNPELLEVLFYFAYLVGVLWTYFRP
ncbi:MAG: iron uptake transporter permease EfeU, partial [Dehalococcoidia bacterium]